MYSNQYELSYNTLMNNNYGDIWKKPAIQNATKGIEHALEKEKFDDILSKFHDNVMSSIIVDNFKECSKTELSKQATEKFLKDFIKKNIISSKKSLEENMDYLIADVNKENEDVIFNLIIEDYTDKYIESNQINVQPIFNTQNNTAEIIRNIAQQCSNNIYEKFRIALTSLENYDYFGNKYKNMKTKYINIINSYIRDKLTTMFGNYFITFVEKNGWPAISYEYKNNINYINKFLIPEMFNKDIINNNISIYTIPYISLSKKYNSNVLQTKWNDYIDGQMMNIFNQHIGESTIQDMFKQFRDKDMRRKYALDKYTIFLEYRIRADIKNNKQLNTILNQYKNSDTKNLISLLFNYFKKNQQLNSKEESK